MVSDRIPHGFCMQSKSTAVTHRAGGRPQGWDCYLLDAAWEAGVRYRAHIVFDQCWIRLDTSTSKTNFRWPLHQVPYE